ncbi:MAG TPA: class I lanthipeptide [Bacteroidia bacterium]|jgi:natural product precursor|nr:class I lanthipeptide [Bacteroidia bacterium]
MKTKRKISLKKVTIANLNKQQLNCVKGGGGVTWINCPAGPSEPPKTTVTRH